MRTTLYLDQVIGPINKKKEHHKSEIFKYDAAIKNLHQKFNDNNSDEYVHLARMSSYHRGAWNTLNKLEKEITNG